jgi:uncharacterized membrane protein
VKNIAPAATEPGEAGPDARAATRRQRIVFREIPRRHLVVLLGLVAGYTVVLTYLCQLRFENFLDGAFDLGVNQQLLWTTSHGYFFYETPDRLISGTNSYLGIHTTYIAALVVPIYDAWPYPATLFALQSAGLASAAFPLYLLLRRFTRDPVLVFGIVLVFLLNFGIISSLLYDFHWEAFLPAEFLWVYFLVQLRLYRWSLVPIVAGFLTIEVFPFFIVGLVALVLYERLQAVGARLRPLLRDRDVRIQLGLLAFSVVAFLTLEFIQVHVIPPLVGSPGIVGHTAGPAASWTVTATGETVQVSLVYWVLLLASVGFLPLLSPKSLILSLPWFGESVILQPGYSTFFGNQYALVAIATLAVGLVEGARWFTLRERDPRWTVVLFGLLGGSVVSANIVAFGWPSYLTSAQVGPSMWLALLMLPAGMLAVLSYVRLKRTIAPKLSVRTVRPWLPFVAALALTLTSCEVFLFDYTSMLLRNQVEPVPLVWLGLLVLPLAAAVLVIALSLRKRSGAMGADDPLSAGRIQRPPTWRAASVAILLIVISFNLALSPIVNPDLPGTGHGYQLPFGGNPASLDMGWITGFIPSGAVVVSASNLFPFVANNPHAWPANSCLPPCGAPPYWPFSLSNSPRYVLTDGSQFGMLPLDLQWQLLNSSIYGTVAHIVSQSVVPGSIYLFEHGYTGPPAVRYATAAPAPYLATATNLTVGPSGIVATSVDSRYGEVIESRAAANVTGNLSVIWTGPVVQPFPALYHLVYNLSGSSRFSTSNPGIPVLRLNVSAGYASAPSFYTTVISAGQLAPGGWQTFEFSVPLGPPYRIVQLQGSLFEENGQPNGSVSLNYIELIAC